jgi:hypothetical protein
MKINGKNLSKDLTAKLLAESRLREKEFNRDEFPHHITYQVHLFMIIKLP